MKSTALQIGERQSRQPAPVTSRSRKGRSAASFADNRPEAAAQRRLLDSVHNSPYIAAQRKRFDGMLGETLQPRGLKDEKLLQGTFEQKQARQHPVGRDNTTGLPDRLKSGIESLSGVSLDNVSVHYNSPEPAQLNAWHVVQQAQEREADVVGTRAVVDVTPGEHSIQRRVHKFSGKRWKPGEKQKEGNRPFPSVEKSKKGDFFNDVTGVVTGTNTEAEEKLSELLIKTGELQHITTKETWHQWDDLGKALKAEFKPEAEKSLILEAWRGIRENPDETDERREEAKEILKIHSDPEIPLGDISFGPDEVWNWKNKLSEERVDHGKISGFLKAFMGANGQLDYIRRQPWFRSGKYGIEIEVNYYPHRGFLSAGGGYHKDTGGNNIFVNIIFHNDDPIPATEWFPDDAKRSKERRNFQGKLLPKKHRQELRKVRRGLRNKSPEPVHGGVAGKHAYASWVDDLIWHATPDFKNRPSATKDVLMKEYNNDNSYKNDSYWPHVVRALAEFSATAVAQHLASRKLRIKEVSEAQWGDIWKEVYIDKGSGVLAHDLGGIPDQTLRFNRFFNREVEAIAKDDRLPLDRQGEKQIQGQRITEQPVGLATRRRSNSDPQKQEAVRAAQKIQDKKRETRSFIRTWVKIVRITK